MELQEGSPIGEKIQNKLCLPCKIKISNMSFLDPSDLVVLFIYPSSAVLLGL